MNYGVILRLDARWRNSIVYAQVYARRVVVSLLYLRRAMTFMLHMPSENRPFRGRYRFYAGLLLLLFCRAHERYFVYAAICAAPLFIFISLAPLPGCAWCSACVRIHTRPVRCANFHYIAITPLPDERLPLIHYRPLFFAIRPHQGYSCLPDNAYSSGLSSSYVSSFAISSRLHYTLPAGHCSGFRITFIIWMRRHFLYYYLLIFLPPATKRCLFVFHAR